MMLWNNIKWRNWKYRLIFHLWVAIIAVLVAKGWWISVLQYNYMKSDKEILLHINNRSFFWKVSAIKWPSCLVFLQGVIRDKSSKCICIISFKANHSMMANKTNQNFKKTNNLLEYSSVAILRFLYKHMSKYSIMVWSNNKYKWELSNLSSLKLQLL